MFGKPHCAIDNDATQLTKILFQQDENEKITLKEGESWDIVGGYSLTLNGIDIDGNKCYFSLYRNNKELDTALVSVDGTIDDRIFTAEDEFGDNSSHIYFITFVDSIFSGADANFAVFKYTWLIDKDKTLSIKSGDKFGSFEVDQTLENLIVMSNANSIKINLNAGSRTNIADEWYFKISDKGKGSNGGYVIYPAKTIVVEEQQPDTAGMNAALNTSGGVQMEGKNNTQPAVAVENTGEKNRETSNEVYKPSSETPDEAETPIAVVNEDPASTGFGGFLAVILPSQYGSLF